MTNTWKKWGNYTLGKIPWINKNRYHFHRSIFEQDVIDKAYNSVLEVGPGEMIEYENIIKSKQIKYAIVEVSDLFIKNCQLKYPEVHIINAPMESFVVDDLFDVVYAASVLEHSRNVASAIKTIMQSAKRFHFVMFKWRYNGDLTSNYNSKKQYWSTCFNINNIIKEIEKHGIIESAQIANRDGGTSKFIPDSKGIHRDGNYLVLRGTCNRDY